MHPHNNFLASPELEKVLDPASPLFAGSVEYRTALTRFLMAGLKALGYTTTLRSLEEESGLVFPRLFDPAFRDLLDRGESQAALDHLASTATSRGLTAQQTSFITFEVLKLAYYRLLLSGKPVDALAMFRTSLRSFGSLFDADKKALSQLYLMKGRTDLVAAIGFDPADPTQLEGHLKRVEYLVLSNQSHAEGFEDPFEMMCRNNLAYQLLTCRFHQPSLAPREDRPSPGTPFSPSASQSDPGVGNLLLGVTHRCPAPTPPLSPYQKLSDAKDEVWRLCFTRSAGHLLASTRNRTILCWEFRNNAYVYLWRAQLEAKEEINDFAVAEGRGRVFVATQNNSVIILDLATGVRQPSIPKAHGDVVTAVYCFQNEEELLTTGVDGFLALWSSANERIREVKTKRVSGMVVAPSESFLLLLHSNGLFLDRVDLDSQVVTANLIREKHPVVSQAIDPTSTYLLINTSFSLPELHLWRLADAALLSVFTGHSQVQYAIGCAFLDDGLVACGSESGVLHIWHVHGGPALATEKRHELSLNAVAVARPAGRPLLLATGSDDGHIILTQGRL